MEEKSKLQKTGKQDGFSRSTAELSSVTLRSLIVGDIEIVDDAFASNEHALLSRRSGRWWLEDLGSKNGTFLNGELLNAPAIVATGDEVGIGKVQLRIELA